MNPVIKGGCCAALSALSMAIMGVCVKVAGHEIPTTVMLFFRFILGLLLLTPLIINRPMLLVVKHKTRIITRSLLSFAALACLFYAIKNLDVASALLLNNTSVLFIPVVIYLLSGTRSKLNIWVLVITGFIGVAFVLPPGKEMMCSTSIIGLLSGLISSLAIYQMRILGKTYSILTILFYYFLISTILSGIWMIPHIHEIHVINWWLLLGIGVSGFIFQIALTKAVSLAPARIVTPVILLSVAFGLLFDWVLWHDAPTVIGLAGTGAIIVSAVLIVALNNSVTNGKTARPAVFGAQRMQPHGPLH
jgi:drug/metabolite transporter (DMT)-like permease